VLPSANMSAGSGQDYFSDGLAEEIINDITPDGKRFAVTNRPPGQDNGALKNDKFVLLLNAFDELRRVASPANK